MLISPIFFRTPLLQKKSYSEMSDNEKIVRDVIRKSRKKKEGKAPRRADYVQNLHFDFLSSVIFATNIAYIKDNRYVQNCYYRFDTLFQADLKNPYIISFYNTHKIWKIGDPHFFAMDYAPIIYDINSNFLYRNIEDWFNDVNGQIARLDILVPKLNLSSEYNSTAIKMMNLIQQEKARQEDFCERLGLSTEAFYGRDI